MLSILIPSYNYNVDNLLYELVSECKKNNFNFEIIIGDDCSSIPIIDKFNIEHSEISLIRNNKNLGRTETRQKLALKAKNDWLLFLDADVVPVNKNFLTKYQNEIRNKKIKVIYGGINYKKGQKNQNVKLRLNYGLKKEVVSAKKRQLNPYKLLASANLLIKKELFVSINKNLTGNLYGFDNIFALFLKEKNSKVLHIENPVWHLGLETNEVYLSKKEKSAETVYKLYKLNKISAGSNDLLKAYEFLKKCNLNRTTAKVFSMLKPILTMNLLGNFPNAIILNIYRLGYFCKLDFDDK